MMDTLSIAVSAILNQDGRPISFESKKLLPSQQNWQAYEQELYAIIHALKTWWHYLCGVEFKAYADHHT